MALFLSVDIHQGDERFSVHSRGKQCAFMSLSALLTARNIPLNSWSSVTFKNALLQGDKMFLNALDSGFIILDPGVEFLSVENLPTVVNVAACRNLFNDFSYEICQTPVQAKTTASPVSVIDTDLPIVVESVEVQTIIDPPIVVEPAEATIIDPPIVVEPVEAKTIIDPPIVVEPVEATTIIDPPIVVEPVEAETIIDPPIVVEPVEATTIIDLPIVVEPVEAQTVIDPPIVVEPVEAQTIIDLPIEAQTNIDPPIEEQSITDMPDDAENENQICLINYGAEFQGLVITDCEIECHYYDIQTALLNTFISDSYAIVILQGYMMALVKQTDNFYLFDSHARDSYVMKFCNIHELEQYLYCLSIELHSNIFEVVPVQLNICKASKQKTKHVNDQEYQNKRLSVETEGATQARLSKASQYKKRKQSEETNSERQIRLQKERESKKRKQSEETDSERQVRLQKERESKKRKRSEETDSERQVRLQKDKMSKKRKRSEESDSERQVRLQKVRESEKRKQ